MLWFYCQAKDLAEDGKESKKLSIQQCYFYPETQVI